MFRSEEIDSDNFLSMYLKDELKKISVDDPKSIPWIVLLLENPKSRLSLPGKINLYNLTGRRPFQLTYDKGFRGFSNQIKIPV